MYLTNGQAVCLRPSVIAHRQSRLAQESSQPCYQASTSEKRPNGGAFGTLRHLLPTLPPDKKLSKIEILRLAICYINYLDNVLKPEMVVDCNVEFK